MECNGEAKEEGRRMGSGKPAMMGWVNHGAKCVALRRVANDRIDRCPFLCVGFVRG